MTIEQGDFIRINYTGRSDDGTVFDTTEEEVAKEHEIYDENVMYEPYVIIVGAGHVVNGLDEDFVGKEAGYHGTVEVPPEKGYGERKTELLKTYPVSSFDEKPVKGMRAIIKGQHGTVTMTIGRRVRVDFNSPMAGKTLTFEYTIEDVINGNTQKVKSLLNSYFRMDFDVDTVDDTVSIQAPSNLWLDESWLLSKQKMAHEILNWMEIEGVNFVETYRKKPKDSNETE